MKFFKGKRISIIIFLALLLTLISPFLNPSFCETNVEKKSMAPGKSLFDEGLNAYRDKDYDVAIEKLNKAFNIFTDSEIGSKLGQITCLHSLGLIYSEIEKNHKALEYLEKALGLTRNLTSQHILKQDTKILLEETEKNILLALGLPCLKLQNYSKHLEYSKLLLAMCKDTGDELNKINALSKIILSLFNLGNYTETIKYCREYSDFIKKHGDNESKMVIMGTMGEALFALRKYSESLSYYKNYLNLIKELNEPTVECWAISKIVLCLFNLGNYTETIKYCREYSDFIKKHGDNKSKIGIIGIMGDALFALGKYSESLVCYKNCLNLIKELNEPTVEANCLFRIGYFYMMTGDYSNAMDYFEQSLELAGKLGDQKLILSIIFNQSCVYNYMGNRSKALDCLMEALKISRELSDKKDEGGWLTEIGALYIDSGDYFSALNYLRQALVIYRNLKIKEEGYVLRKIGCIFDRIGDYNQALQYYQQALDLYKKVEDFNGMGDAYLGIGGVYESLSDFPEAINFANQALQIFKKIGNHGGEGWAYNDIAYYYSNLGQYSNAKSSIQKSLEISKTNSYDKLYIYSIFNMGLIHYKEKDFLQALECFKQAEIKIGKGISARETWFGYAYMGKIEEGLGHLQKARQCYSRAIDTIELIRGNIKLEERKITFLENKLSIYEDMILLLLKLKEEEEAFIYLEKAKSRALLDLLGNRVKLQKKEGDELSEEEIRQRYKLNSLLERLQEEKIKPKGKQRGTVSLWEKEIVRVRTEYTDLLAKIKEKNPELSSLVSINPLKLKEIQGYLDNDTIILEYFTANNKIILWIISNSSLNVVNIPITREVLKEKIITYRKKIENISPDYKDVSQELYNFLIKPAMPYLAAKKLIIVSYGILHYLPFHALVNSDKKGEFYFLIEKYNISYLPSASVLRFVIEKRKKAKDKLLGFGNPDLGDSNYNLPFAEEEVKGIKNLYSNASIFCRDKATEGRAKTLSNKFNIIHFACHGELDPVLPLFSCLKLAKDNNDDGRLEVHELFNLNLDHANLVILSACETALGKLKAGDELIGLTRGFIYAGTPSIIASLWNVSDKSTAKLMSNFYKNLQDRNKICSLNLAQLDLIKNKHDNGIERGIEGVVSLKDKKEGVSYSHPYFWAPFILIGDWE
ncbi:MAG: CHAT domain-containing protein [Thermodesulfobacteriota bacterium]|nr:CHAT domain-containing protein [Thermodesulfobacteriota bacterium]